MLHKVLGFGEFYSLDKETGCESRREWNKDNKKRDMDEMNNIQKNKEVCIMFLT